MKIKSSTKTMLSKTLMNSFSLEIMQTIASELIEDYDLHRRTGIPENLPIQKIEGAKQIANDLIQSGLYVQLSSMLVDIHYNGLMGRKYPIGNIREIINEIQSYGFVYAKMNKMFVEDSSVRISRNWGVLLENEEFRYPAG